MIPPVLTHYITTNKGVVFLCAPPRPNPREGCKKYIPKIYTPGGCANKKGMGGVSMFHVEQSLWIFE